MRVRGPSGEREVRAHIVLSGADPKSTLLGLVGAPQLPVRAVRHLESVRYPGALARFDLLLATPPRFHGMTEPEQMTGHVMMAPSFTALERAADAFERGSVVDELPMTATVLDVGDGVDLSERSGQALLRLVVGGVAAEVERSDLVNRVLAKLETTAAGIGDVTVERALLTPADFESSYGLTGGDVHHGEMTLDQLGVLRPVPDDWGYCTPIENLYLVGAGTHPGGGVTGLPGLHAAKSILRAATPEGAQED